MARESLLQMLEDLASKVRLLESEKSDAVAKMKALEHEKNQAVASAQALEREVAGLANLITLAGEKVEEMLKIGANGEISQPPAVNVPEESKGLKGLGESSADPHAELKGRSPRVFDPTEYRAR
jgi:hypothetical protein